MTASDLKGNTVFDRIADIFIVYSVTGIYVCVLPGIYRKQRDKIKSKLVAEPSLACKQPG